MSYLVGKKALIISGNDNYEAFKNKTLIITDASNTGIGYDNSLFPQMLCDFICEDGTEFPFALYRSEFKLI